MNLTPASFKFFLNYFKKYQNSETDIEKLTPGLDCGTETPMHG